MTEKLIEAVAEAIKQNFSFSVSKYGDPYCEHDQAEAARAAIAAIEASGTHRVVPVVATAAMKANAVGMKANRVNVDLEWANLLGSAPKVAE